MNKGIFHFLFLDFVFGISFVIFDNIIINSNYFLIIFHPKNTIISQSIGCFSKIFNS